MEKHWNPGVLLPELSCTVLIYGPRTIRAGETCLLIHERVAINKTFNLYALAWAHLSLSRYTQASIAPVAHGQPVSRAWSATGAPSLFSPR